MWANQQVKTGCSFRRIYIIIVMQLFRNTGIDIDTFNKYSYTAKIECGFEMDK